MSVRIETSSGLLAATAKVTGSTLATRNAEDVARTGASLFDPFAAATGGAA